MQALLFMTAVLCGLLAAGISVLAAYNPPADSGGIGFAILALCSLGAMCIAFIILSATYPNEDQPHD